MQVETKIPLCSYDAKRSHWVKKRKLQDRVFWGRCVPVKQMGDEISKSAVSGGKAGRVPVGYVPTADTNKSDHHTWSKEGMSSSVCVFVVNSFMVTEVNYYGNVPF